MLGFIVISLSVMVYYDIVDLGIIIGDGMYFEDILF